MNFEKHAGPHERTLRGAQSAGIWLTIFTLPRLHAFVRICLVRSELQVKGSMLSVYLLLAQSSVAFI